MFARRVLFWYLAFCLLGISAESGLALFFVWLVGDFIAVTQSECFLAPIQPETSRRNTQPAQGAAP